MSPGDASPDSGTPGGLKPGSTKNPAVWGLVGVLSGSLISGAVSLVSANMQYESARDTAAETALQARDQFLRDQRVTAFSQYLLDSQTAETAQTDYASALVSSGGYTPEQINFWYEAAVSAQRQFVASAWSVQFFATENLEEAAGELSSELYQRFEMLRTYSGTSDELSTIEDRVVNGQDLMVDLRSKFTTAASAVVSS